MIRLAPIYILILLLVTNCKKTSEASKQEKESSPDQWQSPLYPVTTANNKLNSKWKPRLEAINKNPEKHLVGSLHLYIFWNSSSPIKQQTLTQALTFLEQNDSVKINVISQKPRDMHSIKGKHVNKLSFYCCDQESKDSLALTAYPHCILTTSDHTVCWQGHPSHLTQKTINRILAKQKTL